MTETEMFFTTRDNILNGPHVTVKNTDDKKKKKKNE